MQSNCVNRSYFKLILSNIINSLKYLRSTTLGCIDRDEKIRLCGKYSVPLFIPDISFSDAMTLFKPERNKPKMLVSDSFARKIKFWHCLIKTNFYTIQFYNVLTLLKLKLNIEKIKIFKRVNVMSPNAWFLH